MVTSMATRSARSRRPTNDSAITDSSSSHWASSITMRTGSARAASATRLSTARPTRNGSSDVLLRPAECGVQRQPLGLWELSGEVEDRAHQLVHACVVERHLRLDPGDAENTEPGSGLDGVANERRLADAGRTREHEHTALPRPAALTSPPIVAHSRARPTKALLADVAFAA